MMEDDIVEKRTSRRREEVLYRDDCLYCADIIVQYSLNKSYGICLKMYLAQTPKLKELNLQLSKSKVNKIPFSKEQS